MERKPNWILILFFTGLFLAYFLLFVSFLSECNRREAIQIAEQSESSPSYQEHPHRYWKEVEAVVLKNDTRQWFAGTWWFAADTTVYCPQYDLTATLHSYQVGMRYREYDLREGDRVVVRLESLVYDSTGEAVNREIHHIVRKI